VVVTAPEAVAKLPLAITLPNTLLTDHASLSAEDARVVIASWNVLPDANMRVLSALGVSTSMRSLPDAAAPATGEAHDMLAGTVAATTTEGETATAAPTTPAPAATDVLLPEADVEFALEVEPVLALALELLDTEPLALEAVAALAPLPLAATDAAELAVLPSPPPPPPQAASTSASALEQMDKLRLERAFISELHLIRVN